ncbi:MAG TPA: aldo/keto reductase, partial [Gammaproteobacteria bacterium]|nr:aldo/keto reductase [Gammaproteobacteria bacterium]
LLEQAWSMGITTLDVADIYGDYLAEHVVGQALARIPAQRERFRIVGKCGIALISENRPSHEVKHYDTSTAHIEESALGSIEALGVQRLDTLLIHRPDPLMDPTAVAHAFDALHRRGLVDHFGVSNFTPTQAEMLATRMNQPLAANQVELSLMNPGVLFDGTMDHCLAHRLRPMIWSPLGGGALFGGDPETRAVRAELERVAQETGAVSTAQVALAWVLAHPTHPAVLVGSSRPERWQEAIDALALPLNRQQWFRLLEAARGVEVP